MNDHLQVSVLRELHGRLTLLILAVFFLLGTVWSPNLSAQIVLLVVGIGTIGLAHGAMDHRVGELLFRPHFGNRWVIAFALFYIGFGGIFVGLWIVAPVVALAAFLFYSAVHFGSAAPAPLSLFVAFVRGSLPIILPMTFHSEETSKIFGWVVATQIDLHSYAFLISLACSICFLTTVAFSVYRRSPWFAAEATLLVLLNLMSPPLVSFAIYFVLIHSTRHLIELANWFEPVDIRKGFRRITWEALPLSALTVLGMTAAFFMLDPVQLEAGLIRVLFITLSALTVPHMVLTALAERSFANYDLSNARWTSAFNAAERLRRWSKQ